MSHTNVPTDPQELRDEIVRTRRELGLTVQALAAKTDVKARAMHAVGRSADQARQKVGRSAGQARQKLAVTKDQAVVTAGAVKDRASRAVATVTAGFSDDSRAAGAGAPSLRRRRLPAVALGATVVAMTAAVMILIRQRRS